MLKPLTIPNIGTLTVRMSDDYTWGEPGLDTVEGGLCHLELVLVPEQPAVWAWVEEEDYFEEGQSDGCGSSAGLPISAKNPAKMPVPLRAGLIKASVAMEICVGYHTSGGEVIIYLDYPEVVRIGQTIAEQLAANLNWEEAVAVKRRPK